MPLTPSESPVTRLTMSGKREYVQKIKHERKSRGFSTELGSLVFECDEWFVHKSIVVRALFSYLHVAYKCSS